MCPQKKGPVSARRPQEKPDLLSDSSLRNREKTSVCCLSCPIGGISLWQPEQTNTVMLHERSQTQRVVPCVIPSVGALQNRWIHTDRKQMADRPGLERPGVTNGDAAFFGGDDHLLGLDGALVALYCEYIVLNAMDCVLYDGSFWNFPGGLVVKTLCS